MSRTVPRCVPSSPIEPLCASLRLFAPLCAPSSRRVAIWFHGPLCERPWCPPIVAAHKLSQCPDGPWRPLADHGGPRRTTADHGGPRRIGVAEPRVQLAAPYGLQTANTASFPRGPALGVCIGCQSEPRGRVPSEPTYRMFGPMTHPTTSVVCGGSPDTTGGPAPK